MARMLLARSRISVQCLNPHELHQRAYMPTPQIVTSKVQLITQHSGTHKRMLQMQFVYVAHDHQIDGTNRFWLIIDAATAYADLLGLSLDRE